MDESTLAGGGRRLDGLPGRTSLRHLLRAFATRSTCRPAAL